MAAARRRAIRSGSAVGQFTDAGGGPRHPRRVAAPRAGQIRCSKGSSPFVNAAADALDLSDGVMDDVSRLRPRRPDGHLDRRAPVARDSLLKIADRVPGAGDIVGPAGFLQRLSWYRDMLADTLAAGVPTWEPQRYLYGFREGFH